jgi:hypothetical protein
MPLPEALSHAIAELGAARIVLVLGAGCSAEEPTSLPLSRQLSRDVYQQLLEDHVLIHGDCTDPDDLSCVADAVFQRTQSQQLLVDRMLSRDSSRQCQTTVTSY